MKQTSLWIRTLLMLCIGLSVTIVLLTSCSFFQKTKASVHLPSGITALTPGTAADLIISAESTVSEDQEIRAILMLTVTDTQGNPITLDGSSTTQSAVDLLDPSQDIPLQTKVIQENQVIYVFPATADTDGRYAETAEAESSNAFIRQLQLVMADSAGTQYLNSIIQIDLLVQTRKSEVWKTAATDSLLLGNVQNRSPKNKAELPELTNTRTYDWEIRDGFACLTGIGSVAETDLVIPSQVMLRAADDAETYIEDPLNGTAYPVKILGNAFADCDTITSVTFSEGIAFVDNHMSLDGVGTFTGCDRLKAVYQIPDTVVNMRHTFEGCVSLEQFPDLPECVADLADCFSGCTALKGTATIPHGALDLTRPDAVNGIFEKCSGITLVQLDTCSVYPYKEQITDVSVEFLRPHTEEGQCFFCNTISCATEIDGLEVVFDTVHISHYAAFSEYIDTELSQKLKDTCERLTITDELGKHDSWYYDHPEVEGFSYQPARIAFVHSEPTLEANYHTTIHELAHCFDYTQGIDPLYHDSDEWQALHALEGETMASIYDLDAYYALTEPTQHSETFAGAVVYYFLDPQWLLKNCPNMYSYVDALLAE